MRVLNIGCGQNGRISSAINTDLCFGVRPDVVFDLNRRSWPFRDNTFELIHCREVLEHLESLVPCMEEIHRVAQPGARVHITTPHFSCANSYTDPTHLHHLGYRSFDYFTGNRKENWYTPIRFRNISSYLYFYPKWKNKLVHRIANRWPDFYEEHLTWILPAWFLSFELEVEK